ncbi:hypothetical protein D0865_01910 [Hortaea werneckii]|uniref:Endosomal peripheral membrane protein n=1 Tax=Hortaea werneckii TaxID=91943 RepID=A0A3M7D789_HORWE|nr:hypothetical protein D0865_01910 [Hortaea werneckii]
MTATLLSNELSTLISDSKRKNPDLRNAAERSLQELRSLPATSEQQIAADLSRHPAFVDPFLIACETKNAKFAASGINCLQRLVICKGLPKLKLKDALDAFNASAALGLDVQLKVLQALPSLLQNYADDLKDDLLAGALQVCASLQSAKVQTISGVAAATLQQLVTAVFEKVGDEDRRAAQIPATHDVPGDGEPIMLRPAAFDAYRVFRDLALAAEERPTKFVQLSSLSPESSLELVYSCMTSNGKLFVSHPELLSTIRSNLLPLATRALSEKHGFPMTVRCLRILNFILTRYFKRFPGECEVALGLLTHSLDSDTPTPWKRAMSTEVTRNFFATGALVIEAYAEFDQADGGKPVVQDLLATFVRLSSEKPAIIGLGQQSSIPIGPTPGGDGSDPATMEAAGGVAGVISSALGVAEASVSGISSQWSLPKTSCLDQLDKAEGPTIPDTYIYTMVLDCLNSLSDSLARVVLPLTVREDRSDAVSSESHHADDQSQSSRKSRVQRSQSFRMRAVPANPLAIDDNNVAPRLRAVAGIIDSCWPAFLATASTFLNAALEEQYYRNLIKGFQRFTQVAGLLRLNTPRDALLTTLSKSAVPPHVLSAASGGGTKSPSTDSPRSFSNPRNLLSVDSLVSQATSLSGDRDRRSSIEPAHPMLTTRNLLCLRALLNLAIALGPTLGAAFTVVVDTLRQADLILSNGSAQQLVRQNLSGKGHDTASAVQAFSAEVAAVENAVSRLLESTADYPSEAFVTVLEAFTRLLGAKPIGMPSSSTPTQASPPSTPTTSRRNFSGLPGISTFAEMQARDYKFVIPKLGNLAEMNIPRFVSNDAKESGWARLVDELLQVAVSSSRPREARRAAGDVLCKAAAGVVLEVVEESDDVKGAIQRSGLGILLQIVDGIYSEDEELTATDLEIQALVLEALKAILERCGDSLVAGWDKTLAVIGSAFERTADAPTFRQGDTDTFVEWQYVTEDFVSLPIGRAAFSALQLVCSDFLSMLPTTVVPPLLELLHRFIGQPEDLNLALTSVTISWNVSNHLLGSNAGEDLDVLATRLFESEEKEYRMREMAGESKAAQVILLLRHIRRAVSETQKEVRNASYQILCSIFKSHGSEFGQPTWDLMLRAVVFPVASEDVNNYRQEPEKIISQSMAPDTDSSRTIIGGTADIVCQHIRTIEGLNTLPALWEIFLSTMERYLNCKNHALNTAVYQAMSKILSHVETGSSFWATPISCTIDVWLKCIPVQAEGLSEARSNQDAYSAYLDAAIELYRLTKDNMSPPQSRDFIANVCECIRSSDGPQHGADVNVLSPVQGKALGFLKQMRVDVAGLPPRLITAAAELCLLHHNVATVDQTRKGPTFVAVSSEAVAWLQILVNNHLSEPEVIEGGALHAAVRSLQQLVAAKYQLPIQHKGVPLWQQATTAALAVCPAVLRLTSVCEESTANGLWSLFASLAAGVVGCGGLENVKDKSVLKADEVFDVESFTTLRKLLIPQLGRIELNDGTRQIYCLAMFESSIIHRPEEGEVLDPVHSPLDKLSEIRRGRVKRVPYSQRERMSYLCFEELVALASLTDDSEEATKLAQAAAPLLILRLAIPIRAYIADQPLRGRRPQPLSELEELLFCFDKIKTLKLHPSALAHDPVAGGRVGTYQHLRFLYPLLAQAVATAGDPWSGSEEVLMPLQSTLAAISVPVP